jgi:hypothetical protein
MLDVKEAAHRASEYFAGLYGDQSVSNVQLEEVELTDDGQYWLITLSYPLFPPRMALAGNPELPINLALKRKYKVFKIDAKTGEVKSMKIRNVE